MLCVIKRQSFSILANPEKGVCQLVTDKIHELNGFVYNHRYCETPICGHTIETLRIVGTIDADKLDEFIEWLKEVKSVRTIILE